MYSIRTSCIRRQTRRTCKALTHLNNAIATVDTDELAGISAQLALEDDDRVVLLRRHRLQILRRHLPTFTRVLVTSSSTITSSCCRCCQHYCSITAACANAGTPRASQSTYVSVRQHTSAYVSMRKRRYAPSA